MHPMKHLFNDIYRSWGLPTAECRQPVKHRDAPEWQRREAKPTR